VARSSGVGTDSSPKPSSAECPVEMAADECSNAPDWVYATTLPGLPAGAAGPVRLAGPSTIIEANQPECRG
jgi:hypothetical protein